LRSLINRFYIEKSNGKLRPIGAPNVQTKVLHRFIADMLIHVLEPTRVKNGNHAFRKKKGIHTAIIEIIRNYEKCNKPQIYEFDLKSFFNTVQ
jgi:hypothetical protein